MIQKNNARTDNAENPLPEKSPLDNRGENGYVKLKVATDLGNFPLSGAKVTVYSADGGSEPITTVTTDAMGYAPLLTLPVIYNPEIEGMDPIYYYTDYNLSVSFNYYYPTAIYNVQVFPNITSEFEVNMTPVPAIDPYPDREEQIVIPHIGP
ncbi:MAG TPA: hypothetical protein DCM73_10200 [Clostridiales bacterium]|nr:hypothetical protein [Clostridiales bacterium]